MSMETCHANRAVASRGNGVLRYMKTMSSKERVDPGMVELRSILLLEGDFGRACGQCVGGELERNDRQRVDRMCESASNSVGPVHSKR